MPIHRVRDVRIQPEGFGTDLFEAAFGCVRQLVTRLVVPDETDEYPRELGVGGGSPTPAFDDGSVWVYQPVVEDVVPPLGIEVVVLEGSGSSPRLQDWCGGVVCF